MRDKILIVGGYGAVGRTIALTLANEFPCKVIVAGRRYEKAAALAQESGGKLRPLQFDLKTEDTKPDALENVAVVVMCLDVPDTRFIKNCLLRGVHYVDITAEDAILRQIERLDSVAKEGGSTAILSVGLSPGVTNLLVRYIQQQFESVQNVDIHIFLGLGEAHGSDAAYWTLNNLNVSYAVQENGKLRQVSSFKDRKIVHFPSGLGKRKVYRFNFADQHVVTRTLNLPAVSTWVTFDPAAITMLMAFMRQTGLSKILQYQWATDVIVKLSTAVQYGSDRFAGQVVAQGQLEGRFQTKTVTVTGKGQSRATALVAAQVVRLLYTTRFPSGVFHSEQLFEPMPFIQQLVENDRNFAFQAS